MDLLLTDDYDALSRAAAEQMASLIAADPAATLVVATGETPIGAYRKLAARQAGNGFGGSCLRVVQLDEYLELAPDDRRSLYRWMDLAFLEPLGVPEANVIRLPVDAPDPEAACRAFDRAVAALGGIDLAVLGLGPNGHLGFNEPPADPDSPTRVVALSEASLESNARYWGGHDQVPRRAMTVGMAVLLAARRILLLVAGGHKREILRRVVQGPVTPDVPASFLQRIANVTIIADRTAWGASPAAGARPVGSDSQPEGAGRVARPRG
jgi:glucosamine-6-phosphate deaminase